jgi:four helix bundle protein
MAKSSLIQERSFAFAQTIVLVFKKLVEEREYILSKQLLRSGTSIGANVREASAAQSRKDFLHKMSIASKEARETVYWLELIATTSLSKHDLKPVMNEAKEISNILTSIVKTTSESMSLS